MKLSLKNPDDLGCLLAALGGSTLAGSLIIASFIYGGFWIGLVVLSVVCLFSGLLMMDD